MINIGPESELSLQGEKRERLMKLAAQIAAEQDPKKFQALLVELNELLQEQERRFRTQGNPTDKSTHE